MDLCRSQCCGDDRPAKSSRLVSVPHRRVGGVVKCTGTYIACDTVKSTNNEVGRAPPRQAGAVRWYLYRCARALCLRWLREDGGSSDRYAVVFPVTSRSRQSMVPVLIKDPGIHTNNQRQSTFLISLLLVWPKLDILGYFPSWVALSIDLVAPL